MKKLMIAAVVSGLWAVMPAQAAEMAMCDEATMMKADEMIKATTDKGKMEMAMKEMDMAKMAMKDNKAEDCSMHLTKVMEETMKP